jgi:hypothetical protein
MSAIGSVIKNLLPTRFNDARDFTRERQLPETDAAELEFPQIASRPAAALASAVVTDGEFLFLCFFSNG